MPVPKVSIPDIPVPDKLVHLLFYTTIMLWFGLIYRPGRSYKRLGVLFFLMGIVIEVIQGFTSYRSMDVMDMLSNAAGLLFGSGLARTRLAHALVYVEDMLGLS
jgi:VanZ family protein